VKAEYIVGKLEDTVQNLDKTSSVLDMLQQGALSVDDAARQGCLADIKPLNVDMDVFARDSVVCLSVFLGHIAAVARCSCSLLL